MWVKLWQIILCFDLGHENWLCTDTSYDKSTDSIYKNKQITNKRLCTDRQVTTREYVLCTDTGHDKYFHNDTTNKRIYWDKDITNMTMNRHRKWHEIYWYSTHQYKTND